MKNTLTLLIAALSLTACGPKECKIDDPSSCSSDQVCEAVTGQDKPSCFTPVRVTGKVFDLSTQSKDPIAGAQVTALDDNGAPVSAVVTTASDGTYSIPIPSSRADSNGTPVARKITLRAAAQDFAPFPSGIRTALPLDTGTATRAGGSGPYLLSGAGTDVGLAPLDQAERGRPKISGTVDVDATQKGVLVVAEQTGGTGSNNFASAVADSSGAFTLFNVVPATYSVRGFSRGVNYTPVDVSVVAGANNTGVHLVKSTTGTAALSNKVQTVAGGPPTSIVLAVKSTFNTLLARGEVVPGLRAPEPGIAPNVAGNFTIAGIPDGDYMVLAGFENDGAVRDPDPGLGGTAIQSISVRDGAILVQPSSFKTTTAVNIVSPGAGDLPEDVATATPTFQWSAYSNAAFFNLELIDELGVVIWTKTHVTTTQATYDGTTALASGGLYQWRATAYRTTSQGDIPTSLTEDLKGVFRVALP
ncbi:MAG TPA: hypothetical protein VFA20_01280 [Myxococcaceae bacterium]|nr:hypothetical protein [Myxococcaceae bacterium]